MQMIRSRDAKVVADALHERYNPVRAMVLIARVLQKALFAGRADDVVFWALVYAHYRGGDLSPSTQERLSVFSAFLEYDIPEKH
jgi:hypothetical protein